MKDMSVQGPGVASARHNWRIQKRQKSPRRNLGAFFLSTIHFVIFWVFICSKHKNPIQKQMKRLLVLAFAIAALTACNSTTPTTDVPTTDSISPVDSIVTVDSIPAVDTNEVIVITNETATDTVIQ